MEQLDAGALYVVATPIGHLGDLSHRAEAVLKAVQIIAAEDTRRSRVLLDHIDHRAPELLSLHAHNEGALSERLVQRMLAGADVALISDAGTPLVNDPGFELLRAAHAVGLKCVPVPGPCAITTALSVCPLPAHPYRYVGFLPAKAGARRKQLRQWLGGPDALVFLEAPHRIIDTLHDIGEVSERRVMLGRELTKQFETVLTGTPAELIEQLADSARGEFTCIVESGPERAVAYDDEKVLTALLKNMPPSQAAKIAAEICGVKKSQMYELALQLAPSD